MSDCLFCKIVAGVIPCHKVWEDDRHLAFMDINPIREGHALVIPKTHAPYLFEMDDVGYQSLLAASKEVAKRLKEVFSVPRIGMAVEGFAVDHVHIHLVPLTSGNQLNPELAKPGDHTELAKLAERIRT
ncbi:MAG: HIT family protein [Candidatus Uhrbacteria bacterium]|nr:HIT family protein [Candidatus Uhrbacteria bacterium]